MQKIIGIVLVVILLNGVAYAHEHDNYVLNAIVTKNSIQGDVAVYNLSNAKLHTSGCEWAEKCTKNCIFLDKKELKHMFYIPCMVCGGGVVDPIEIHNEE